MVDLLNKIMCNKGFYSSSAVVRMETSECQKTLFSSIFSIRSKTLRTSSSKKIYLPDRVKGMVSTDPRKCLSCQQKKFVNTKAPKNP